MNLMRYKYLFAGLLVATLLISVVSLFVNPYNGWGTKPGSALNYGVDFIGGTKIYFPVPEAVSSQEVTEILEKIDLPNFKFNPPQPNRYIDSTGVERHQVLVYTRFLNDAEQTVVLEALEAKYGQTSQAQGLDIVRVDPLIGKELLENAFKAGLIAIVLMLVYITVRFEFLSGITAILTLAHDSLLVLGMFALLGLEVNATMIAAILTVIGYSINDTIVLFDRIRENLRSKRKETTYTEIVNESILQTFRRSLNTSLTTVLSILVLFLTVGSIREFCFAMIVGMTAGSYSTLFIAGSVWAIVKDWQAKRQSKGVVA